MAKKVDNTVLCILGVVVVLVAVGLLYQNYKEYFQTFPIDCSGITCEEGQFCQNNTCQNVYVPATSEPEGY
jgi:hypothetical protein